MLGSTDRHQRREERIMSTLHDTAATTAQFDTAAFRRAIEERDSAAVRSFYTDDAELVVVDRETQPSKPRVLRGSEAIGAYFDDVCGRDMTHKIDRIVLGDGGAAFLETCAYPDGTKVRCAAVLDLRDGRIVRQSGVQAWDE
jgi:ketosteroid isomerase-like protein